MSGGWIDISVPVRSGMVHWPGDADVRIERTLTIAAGDGMNLTRVSMSAHTGTHMDAPIHFLDGRESIDALPLEATVGPARVIEIASPTSIEPEELERHDIREGERLLFKTPGAARCWAREQFCDDYAAVSERAARFLAERRVRTVGVDYLSVAPFDNPDEPHRILLGAGIWVIEGLNLAGIEPGHYDLVCLPLKLVGSDGAPARAIVRKLP